MKKAFLITCLALLIPAFGCDKPKEATEPAAEEPAAEAPAEAPKEETAEKPAEEAAPKIALKAEGEKIDPPIKPEQLPDGAWYCDMGTVHWAATDKPEDGKCPECGMALKQYASAGAASDAKPAEKGHGHGHEHGEGDDHGHEH